MKIGYARVSTQDQNLQLQLEALQKEECEIIFQEKASGVSKKRPEWDDCIKLLRKGDTLVVWKIDRVGRSLKTLIEIVEYLKSNEINFKTINGVIDTTTPHGKLFFHIFAAFAEYERNLNRERTMAGLAAARAEGRVGGRPKGLTKEGKTKALATKTLYLEGFSHKEISKQLGISKTTVYKYLKLKGVPTRAEKASN